ncbi:hypothetical protein LGH70_13740 [Hymenobacter sp. BT635]|uniref:Lipoprotein n=1 Tax=Hymenobacter nitidus TaxID=2880929 RepID=A0ABS8AE01_9BACT|nr:hypothetical protein [Hymenobacter nitidus]MCB2378658.1 hypothetical protein [Hymenobacter nitidus]
MRLKTTPSRSLLACLALLAGLGLAGCSEKENVAPEEAEVPCGTLATVRLCHGYTAGCLTEHTTLSLPDGTLISPSGPIWEAYEQNQVHGQVLVVGYALGGTAPAGSLATTNATITCLESRKSVDWCGTPDIMNSKPSKPSLLRRMRQK